jgi:hypothetical protein
VKGDFIRIDIPGPGTLEASFDWVKITDISDQHAKEDEFENISINCCPSKEPVIPARIMLLTFILLMPLQLS